jgi:hypothetical protein
VQNRGLCVLPVLRKESNMITFELDNGTTVQAYGDKEISVVARTRAGWIQQRMLASKVETGMYLLDGDKLRRIERT